MDSKPRARPCRSAAPRPSKLNSRRCSKKSGQLASNDAADGLDGAVQELAKALASEGAVAPAREECWRDPQAAVMTVQHPAVPPTPAGGVGAYALGGPSLAVVVQSAPDPPTKHGLLEKNLFPGRPRRSRCRASCPAGSGTANRLPTASHASSAQPRFEPTESMPRGAAAVSGVMPSHGRDGAHAARRWSTESAERVRVSCVMAPVTLGGRPSRAGRDRQ